jgi:hypothetical protein
VKTPLRFFGVKDMFRECKCKKRNGFDAKTLAQQRNIHRQKERDFALISTQLAGRLALIYLAVVTI